MPPYCICSMTLCSAPHIRDTVEDNTVLIFLNAVDSRTAVKKEAETKAKSLGELEESAGDA